MDDEERSGFLPPVAPGPEPELGGRPAPAPQPPEYGQQQQYAPPPGYGQQPSAGHGRQQPPPGAWYPSAQQVWSYPQQNVPDNPQALTGFILSLVGVGLLVVSVGLSSLISVGLSIAGIVLGRRGVRRVDGGETPKHRSLGQAGFVIGIVGVVLGALATAGWLAVMIAALADDDFRDELEQDLDESQSLSILAAAVARAGLHLLA